MLGPIDYVVVGFIGNEFDGSIMQELSKAVDSHTIRVLDLVFVMKDEEGNIIEGEYEEQPAELQAELAHFDNESGMPLLTEHDIAKIGEQMKANTAAGVLVIEHLWARDLKKAISRAGGFLIADGRVHPDMADAAVKELETTVSK
jgi:hypothetical protein